MTDTGYTVEFLEAAKVQAEAAVIEHGDIPEDLLPLLRVEFTSEPGRVGSIGRSARAEIEWAARIHGALERLTALRRVSRSMRKVVAALASTPNGLSAVPLAECTGLGPGRLLPALSRLERHGVIQSDGGLYSFPPGPKLPEDVVPESVDFIGGHSDMEAYRREHAPTVLSDPDPEITGGS